LTEEEILNKTCFSKNATVVPAASTWHSSVLPLLQPTKR
jgi:hypothetical protein